MTTAVTTPKERPVFVASGDRRARGLRYAAVLAVVLACVWLVALGVGMLGFGRLPGASLPLGSRGADAKHDSGADAVKAAPASAHASRVTTAAAVISRRAAVVSRDSAVVPRKAKSGQAAKVHRPSPEPAAQAAAPASPASAPATPHTGWARHGATAPPGQTTRVKAQPPGQTRRQGAADPTTVPATPVTTPAPPGQQKKTEEPKQ